MYGYSKVDSRTASHPTTAPHAARTSANTASRKTRGMHTMSKTPNQLHHTPTHPRCLRTRLRARRACDADGGVGDDAGGGESGGGLGRAAPWRNGIIVLAAAAEAC